MKGNICKKLLHHPAVILFSVIVLGLTIADILTPDKKISEFENKMLSDRPSFRLSDFVDGTFSTKYVSYINDQFVGRNQWVSLKAAAEKGTGKLENNGILLGKDGFLFEKLQLVESKPETSQTNVVERKTLNKSIRMVKEFLEQYPQLPITFSLVPNSSEVLYEKVPGGFNRVNQEKETAEIYQQLSNGDTQFLNFYDTLRKHTDEYIYYRTDHHWTTLGAYYAYTDYCKEKGLTPVSLDSLQKNTVPDFYGTFYSKAKMPGTKPDTITWYDIPVKQFAFHTDLRKTEVVSKGTIVEEDGLSLLSVPGMYDESKFSTRDKYAALTWGNSGYIKIESAHNLNHEEGKVSKLLLIKDSYANSMIPFLVYNYDEIDVVDLRAAPKKMNQILKEKEYDDIFVMYNFSTFSSDASNLANLRF